MKTSERNLGIDLLRVLCMLAVVVQHILGHGWVIAVLDPATWKYELLVALRAGTYFGISCFALISGYVGVQAKYRYSALLVQWIKVWLYSVLLTGVMSLLHPGEITASHWNSAFYPALTQQYWYFSAYAGSFMLAPIVRTALKNMSFVQASVCTGMLALGFSILNCIKGGDPFFTNVGKGTLWIVVLYAMGGYFGVFKPHEKVPMVILWAGAVLSMLLLAGFEPVAGRLGWNIQSRFQYNDSPETLLAAVTMLLLFSRIRITRGKRLITALSGASFGVYLIHDHPLVRRYTISVYSYHLAGLDTLTIVPGVLLAAAGVYLICAGIDTVREKLFGLLKIKSSLAAWEQRLIGNLWED